MRVQFFFLLFAYFSAKQDVILPIIKTAFVNGPSDHFRRLYGALIWDR